MPKKIGPKKPIRHFLKEHRLKAGLTQKALAARLDTHEMTVSRWEKSETNVDMDILAAVAEALPGDLIADDLLHHPDEPTADQMLRQLPADDRNHFMKQIKNAQKLAS